MMKWKTLFTLALFAVVTLACSDGQQGLLEPEADYSAVPMQPALEVEIPDLNWADPSPEQSFDLLAGQDMLAGHIVVWSNAENLFVQYRADPGYCLTEVHLQPFVELDEVPSRNGNPIPGKFLESRDYAPDCVSETEVFQFPIEDQTSLKLAAHAVVAMPVDGCADPVWQLGDVETADPETGLLNNYADEFNWEGATPTAAGPGLNISEPGFTTPFIVGTTPTNKFPYNSNKDRGYATDIDVVWTGALWFGGDLTVSWSPGQSANEVKVLSEGGVDATFSAVGAAAPGEGWFLDKYPLVEHSTGVDPLPFGDHTINFLHEDGDGTFWDWIRLEQPCIQFESAWGAGGGDFPGKNWATYITYSRPYRIASSEDLVVDKWKVDGVEVGQDSDTREVDFLAFDVNSAGDTGYLFWSQQGGAAYHNIAIDQVGMTFESGGTCAEMSGIAVESTSREGDRLNIKVCDLESGDSYQNNWEGEDLWEYAIRTGDIGITLY